MKGAAITAAAVVVLVAMIGLMAERGQAVSCGQVDSSMVPCVSYLTQGGGDPTPACCSGVKAIQGMASTTADRRVACNCLKDAANRYPNLKDDAAQALPDKCGVKMDIPVSRTTNCDAIN